MNFLKVKDFINRFGEDDDFTGGINEEKIIDIQTKLNVELPESYKWFLRNYGSGGIFGVDILGHGKVSARVVTVTEDYQKNYGLTEGIVVIEDIDIFAYCLDTNKLEDGECPVIIWDNKGGYENVVGENFLEFFFNHLQDKKENWEEDEDWDDED